MSYRREILFGAYNFLKKLKFIEFKNSFSNHANILAFHRVNDYDKNSLSTPISMFEKLMVEIKERYHPCSLSVLKEKILNGNKINPRTVVITFDDGYHDNILHAMPILKKYDIPATFFITSGYINTERAFPWDKKIKVFHPLMTWDDVRRLHNLGFEIGAHTMNHINLGEFTLEEAKNEIVQSKNQIEYQINHPVVSFAVPFGHKNSIRNEIPEIVRKAGFTCCCMLRGGKANLDSNLFALPRVPVYATFTEMMMELDNFMIYYDQKMKFNLIKFYSFNK